MTIWFSPETMGFYDSALFEIQPGFIEISSELRTWLLNGQGAGQIIVMGEDGMPTLADPPPISGEALRIKQSAKLLAASNLAAAQKTALTNRIGVINDAIEFEEATEAEIDELPVRQAQLTAWKRYAVLLGRVTAQAGWYEIVEWPTEPADGMDLSVSATVSRPAAG